MKNGGPAFPIGSGDMRDPVGMTMRDYFAEAALTGDLSTAANFGQRPENLARHAYKVADAMLAERERET